MAKPRRPLEGQNQGQKPPNALVLGLGESLRRHVCAGVVGWTVQVVHPQLAKDPGELIIENVSIRDHGVPGGGGLEVRTADDRKVPLSCYVQLFVQLSRAGSNESFLFLPHGPFSAGDYRRPYRLLIENPPEVSVLTQDIVRPARVLRQPVSDCYHVMEKMRVGFASAEATPPSEMETSTAGSAGSEE